MRGDPSPFVASELLDTLPADLGPRIGTRHAHAATPGTLSQRDVLRGTGGSAYFLKRQDITIGSETVTIEVRDVVMEGVRAGFRPSPIEPVPVINCRRATKARAPPRRVEPEAFRTRSLRMDERDIDEEEVRLTAYFLWEQDGCPEGRAQEYWYRAWAQHRRMRASDEELQQNAPPPEEEPQG
jgi:hypothetical protein